MEVIRKFIDANSLMSIMALPEAFRNRKLEVIVLPTDEESAIQQKPDVAGIVQSLVGAIPHTDMTLSELRDERLGKYEAAIDTNVVLDVLLRREPFFRAAAEVLNLTQRDEVREYVSASAITDIYYIANKQMKDRDAVRDLLKRLLMVVSVAAVSEREIQNALNLAWGDFEDSV